MTYVYIAIIAAILPVTLRRMDSEPNLEMPWLQIDILAGKALTERQYILEGKAQYVNVWGGVHWKGVYWVGSIHLGYKIFLTSY